MLDLALSCDLLMAEPQQQVRIRARHGAIQSQPDAANYIREVEDRIHKRRKFKPVKAAAIASVAASPKPVVTVPKSQIWPSTAMLLLLLFTILAGLFVAPGLNFALVAALMIAMMAVMGKVITKRPLGILINDRNLMSLARFQMALWTVAILSAYLTFAMVRVRQMGTSAIDPNAPSPLDIKIDWTLWSLLGISTTSLVGAPLILSGKMDKEPDPAAATKTAPMLGEKPNDILSNSQGTLYANKSIGDAQVTDMFQGDEISNTAQIDLAKVQMFYFTAIAVVCFSALVIKSLIIKSDLSTLPVLPSGLVAVMGISHAGYLASKGIDHTKEQN